MSPVCSFMQLFDLAVRANATLSNITPRNLKIIGKFTLKSILVPYGPQREKTCLRGLANNTGADQPAHPRSLISAFVIRVL